MRLVALIDADIVLYQVAAKHEVEVPFDEDDPTIMTDIPEAKNDIERFVSGIQGDVHAVEAVMVFSGKDNFRKKLYPDYKSGRKHRKPVGFRALKEWAENTFRSTEKHTLEADDVLGILATGKWKEYRGDLVICSIDKDLRQIPGLHYDWRKPEDGVTEISQDAADVAFLVQALSGDPTDSYPGCPGRGEKTARRVVEPAFNAGGIEEAWKKIVSEYAAKGLDEDYALTQARVARILRAEDWDNRRKKARLWKPPVGSCS